MLRWPDIKFYLRPAKNNIVTWDISFTDLLKKYQDVQK